ncbi:unnamed protein product [Gongylonema pulchrum]|uniref:Calcineurin-like phosphoesterase domain-containing protein n=1 Tax=Gongylonema pulchrum TaxID=637853 RepID=A0A3P6Q615_9BILA|nr:unnamed protein product [Gongylonema pulchrum]
MDSIHDYRKGNRARQLAVLELAFFMIPFHVFAYFRLVQFTHYWLSDRSNDRLKKHHPTRHIQLISWIILFWLFLVEIAHFLYFIPSLVPDFFYDLCLLSLGLWYHFIIPLLGFAFLKIVICSLNAIAVCRPVISYCFLKFPSVKTLCMNNSIQVTLTLAVAIFLSYATFMLRDKIAVKRLTVRLHDLPSDTNGFQFAVISDLHAGASVYKEQIARVIFFVGDAIDAPRDVIEDRVKTLRYLNAKTFYVSGNHDYYYGNAAEWFELFSQYGFEVLNNRHVNFRGLCIAGVNDYSSERSGLPDHKFQPVRALKGCAQNSTVIVLSHNPASAQKIAFNDAHLRVDLIVSG